jgi:tetratricopeptide (TPR) repeat protein
MKARYGLARLLAQRGDMEASREQFEAYQRLYQEDQERAIADERWNGALDLARHLLAQNQAAEALGQLEVLPETVEVLELRSQALLALGRDEEAVAALQRAVVLDPGRAALRRRLGELRAKGASH